MPHILIEHIYSLVCFHFKDRKWMLSPQNLNSSRFVTSCFLHEFWQYFKIWNLIRFLHCLLFIQELPLKLLAKKLSYAFPCLGHAEIHICKYNGGGDDVIVSTFYISLVVAKGSWQEISLAFSIQIVLLQQCCSSW